MTGAAWLQIAALIALILIGTRLLGPYLAKVYGGDGAPGDRVFLPVERALYRFGGIAGKLVTHRQLLQEVWGPQYERETNYLRVYFAQIRRKLEPEPSRPRYFITEARMGYRFIGG